MYSKFLWQTPTNPRFARSRKTGRAKIISCGCQAHHTSCTARIIQGVLPLGGHDEASCREAPADEAIPAALIGIKLKRDFWVKWFSYSDLQKRAASFCYLA